MEVFFQLNLEKPIEINKKIYVEFLEDDLIYFDPVCKNFFK